MISFLPAKVLVFAVVPASLACLPQCCGPCAQERGVLNPLPGGEEFVANPALPEDILREAVRR